MPSITAQFPADTRKSRSAGRTSNVSLHRGVFSPNVGCMSAMGLEATKCRQHDTILTLMPFADNKLAEALVHTMTVHAQPAKGGSLGRPGRLSAAVLAARRRQQHTMQTTALCLQAMRSRVLQHIAMTSQGDHYHACSKASRDRWAQRRPKGLTCLGLAHELTDGDQER